MLRGCGRRALREGLPPSLRASELRGCLRGSGRPGGSSPVPGSEATKVWGRASLRSQPLQAGLGQTCRRPLSRLARPGGWLGQWPRGAGGPHGTACLGPSLGGLRHCRRRPGPLKMRCGGGGSLRPRGSDCSTSHVWEGTGRLQGLVGSRVCLPGRSGGREFRAQKHPGLSAGPGGGSKSLGWAKRGRLPAPSRPPASGCVSLPHPARPSPTLLHPALWERTPKTP